MQYLKQHEFYVYHDGANVMARRGTLAPVVAKTFPSRKAKDSNGKEAEMSAQDAHDFVQTIVNPKGLAHDHPSLKVEAEGYPGKTGFHHPSFQQAISGNCEAFVKAAYAAGKK